MPELSHFFFNNETCELIMDADVPAGMAGVTEVTSLEQLTGLGKDTILKIHASVFGSNSPADIKKSEKKLAKEILDELTRSGPRTGAEGEQANNDSGAEAGKPGKTQKAPKEPKPPAEKKPSKMDNIKKIVQERGVISRKELAGLIGSDETNTHTMVSILKNPDRTKEPVTLQYDKETKCYGWPGVEMPKPTPAADPAAENKTEQAAEGETNGESTQE